MKLPTIDEFIQGHDRDGQADNSWVRCPGFKSMYVRRSARRSLCGSTCGPVLDLANMEARCPGSGAFKRLVARLRKQYPNWILYVENVLTKRFCDGLERLGFVRLGTGRPTSFCLLTSASRCPARLVLTNRNDGHFVRTCCLPFLHDARHKTRFNCANGRVIITWDNGRFCGGDDDVG